MLRDKSSGVADKYIASYGETKYKQILEEALLTIE
jgi:hypothetical protein